MQIVMDYLLMGIKAEKWGTLTSLCSQNLATTEKMVAKPKTFATQKSTGNR